MAESDLDYAKVTGRFGLLIADTDDAGDNPDIIWCDEGEIDLVPLTTITKIQEATPFPFESGQSVFTAQISAADYVDPTSSGRDGAGHLTYSGKPFMTVVDLTTKVNPAIGAGKATHRAVFRNLRAQGTKVDFPSRTVRLTKDGPGGDGVNDLVLLLPVVVGESSPITVGPPGVSVESATISPTGDLVFTLTNGSETDPVPLPAATEILDAADTAAAAADTATTKAGEASGSASAADTAKNASEAARTAAETARTGAEAARTGAEAAQTAAETAQTAAAGSATAADGSATAAAGSASTASSAATTATTKAGEAASSATAASDSATAAATSESNAAASESAAATSETNAAASETAAAGYAASAAGSVSLVAWAPSTAYAAGDVRQAPDGSTIRRLANGTSGATFDATEEAAWTAVAADGTTIVGKALTASFEHKVSRSGATTGQVPTLQADGSLAFSTVSGGGGGAPTGAAGGSLAGTYPNPTLAAGAVNSTEINAAIKDAAAGTASLRTLGTGAQQAAAGNHGHAASAITGLAAVATSGSASDITTGTLPNSVLPPLAISETFPVASQAAMLALAAQQGDVAIRTDLNKSFILSTNSPSTLADWKELLTPTDAVTSVAGKVGVVSLVKADITDLGTIGTAAAKNTGTGAGQIPVLSGTPGTPDGTKFLRDDGTWATASGGGSTSMLAMVYYRPASTTTVSTTATSPADVDATNLVITGTVPASGTVIIRAAGVARPAISDTYYWSLRTGTTNLTNGQQTVAAGSNSGNSQAATRVTATWRITGLTPGAAFTYKLAHCTGFNGSCATILGGNDGPVVMEAWAG